MKYEQEYTNLSNAIRWKNQSLLLDTLNKNSDLDLTYKEGKFFIMSIEDNNIEIVQTLLDYFNNNQLAKYTSGSIEYLLLKNKMRDILEIAIEGVSLSKEMQEVLNQYLPTEEDSDHEQELDDIVMPFFNKSNEDIKRTELTEDNLKKLEVVENNQIKNFEDLMGFNSPRIETDLGNDHHDNNDQNQEIIGKDSHFVDSIN